MAAEVVRALSLCMALLLLVAIAHKAHVLRAGEARQEPLIELSAWRRRHATAVIAAALLAELVLAAALVIFPTAGFAGVTLLLAVYAGEIRRLPAEKPCNCFGRVVRANGGVAAVRRNVALGVATAAGLLVYVTGAVGVASLSGTTVGVALIFVAALAAVEALGRLKQWTSPQSATPGG